MLPIKTILHPTDFSEHSAYASQLACALAHDYGARLIVTHVMCPPISRTPGSGPLTHEPGVAEDEVRERLRAECPADPTITVEYCLCEGHVAATIVALAEGFQTDLIVMGTQGRSGLGRLVLGSVAEAVLRRASCPVLAVRLPSPAHAGPGWAAGEAGRTRRTIQTVLFPADFSECSFAAFPIARALVRDYGARLVVLHVATPPPFVIPRELERALRRPDGYRAELQERLREVYAPDSPAGVEYRVRDGDPDAEILRAAREESCDLVVMGTHGRTGLGRVLLGSTAEAVLRRSPCPLLAVRVPAAVLARSSKPEGGKGTGPARRDSSPPAAHGCEAEGGHGWPRPF
jgi:nucleotide-binding universal stress UspA family protein